MRVLLWHVHGSWTTAFLQGSHDYVLPVVPGRGPDGRGRAETWTWPPTAVEMAPEQLAEADLDVVVLQRPHEVDLVEQWTRRRPGRDVAAVYVEHNTPGGEVPFTRHPLADRRDIPVVHVTHFNRLFWDTGVAPAFVVEHGVVDPGHRYSGELPRAAVVVNEPLRRGRAVGTDLLPGLAAAAPVDVFGMGTQGLAASLGVAPERMRTFNVAQDQLHSELARRRVYVHLTRWTSLGLSLVEAMHLGMPVVALATTEVSVAVPPDAGMVTTRPEAVHAAVTRYVGDPVAAQTAGALARQHALQRFGLRRFLAEWDALLASTSTA